MEAKRLVRNISFITGADVVTKVLSILIHIAIARSLGEWGLGEYAFYFAFAAAFASISDLGAAELIIKEVAKRVSSPRAIIQHLFLPRLILSTIALLIPGLTIFFVADTLSTKIGVWLALIAYFFSNMSFLFRAVIQGKQEMHKEALIRSLERMVAIAGSLLALYLGYGLKTVVAVHILSHATTVVQGAWYCRKWIQLPFDLDIDYLKKFFKQALPFWLTATFTYLYYHIDTLLLTRLTDFGTVGIYNAALTIVIAFQFLPKIIAQTLFPALAQHREKNKHIVESMYHKAKKYLLFLAFPVVTGTIAVSDLVIKLIYTDTFQESAIALSILIVGFIFISLVSLYTYLLAANNRQGIVTKVTATTLVLNVIITIILVPKYTYIGAAIATLITQALNAIGLRLALSKEEYKRPKNIVLKPLLASLLMGATVFYLRQFSESVFILIPIGVIIYGLLLLALRAIGKEEIALLKHLSP